MFGQAAPDGPGLLRAKIQRKQLLLAIRIPQSSLLLLRDYSKHTGNRQPHHLTATHIQSKFTPNHPQCPSKLSTNKNTKKKHHIHLGELVRGTAGDLCDPEQGKLRLELLELGEKVGLRLRPELMDLNPRFKINKFTSNPNETTPIASNPTTHMLQTNHTKHKNYTIQITKKCPKKSRIREERRRTASRDHLNIPIEKSMKMGFGDEGQEEEEEEARVWSRHGSTYMSLDEGFLQSGLGVVRFRTRYGTNWLCPCLFPFAASPGYIVRLSVRRRRCPPTVSVAGCQGSPLVGDSWFSLFLNFSILGLYMCEDWSICI